MNLTSGVMTQHNSNICGLFSSQCVQRGLKSWVDSLPYPHMERHMRQIFLRMTMPATLTSSCSPSDPSLSLSIPPYLHYPLLHSITREPKCPFPLILRGSTRQIGFPNGSSTLLPIPHDSPAMLSLRRIAPRSPRELEIPPKRDKEVGSISPRCLPTATDR